MTYAHIYKARNKQFLLMITTGASISEGVLQEMLFNSRADAKSHARSVGAVAHNY